MSVPILLDCDPGHDDAVAILLACGSPAIELRAVTTTFGNTDVAHTTRNALQVLDLAGASDVPVAAGAAGPLSGAAVFGHDIHGASGLGGAALPPPSREPDPREAVALMADTIATSERPLTIVATGPITNVARLLRERAELRPRIAEIVFMGGSTVRGNRMPYAEFNAFSDPEALDVCLRSGVPIRMVGLNLTHQALATPAIVERIAAVPGVLGQVTSAWMGFYGASYQRVCSFDAPPVHDPCTIAALAAPSLIGWQEAYVAVELDGRWTRGATVVDLDNRLGEAPNCRVAMTLDVAGYWDLVLDALARLAGDSDEGRDA